MEIRRLVAAGLAGLVLVSACQPVDERPDEDAEGGQSPDEASTAEPADLDDVLARFGGIAAEWHDDPRPVEIVVDRDGGRGVVTVTYLAPDADRLLQIRDENGSVVQDSVTFDVLALEPVPAAALAEVPATPEGLLGPDELAEAAAAATEGCGVDEVVQVVYSTGAPAAWNGEGWTEPPRWAATIVGPDRAVVVDPVSGAAAGDDACLDLR